MPSSRRPQLSRTPLEAYTDALTKLDDARRSGSASLSLMGLRIDRLPPLNGLTNVTVLDLSGTKINDLSSLSQMKALESLYLDEALVSNLETIASLPKLKYLDLSRTRVEDLAPLAKCNSLRKLILGGTQVSDISPLQGLELEWLYLGGTQVSDLLPLSSQEKLTRLHLGNTRVKSIFSVSRSQNLEFLNITNTAVEEISVVERLRNLQALNVSKSRVYDLRPIVSLTALVRAAAARPEEAGISFEGCPISDPKIREFSFLKNPVRTLETVNYLRTLSGFPAIGLDAEEYPSESSLKKLSESLDQDPFGFVFEPSDSHLAIAAPHFGDDVAAANSAIVQQLHEKVRRKAQDFSQLAQRLANSPGWQSLASEAAVFSDLMSMDLDDLAQQIGLAWCGVVSLASFIEQDREVRRREGGFIESLEPEMQRALLDLVQTSGPWLRYFPTAQKLDDQHALFEQPKESVSAARDILITAGERDIVPREDIKTMDRALAAGERSGHHSSKVRSFGVLSVKNLVIGSIGFLAMMSAGFFQEVGSSIARHSVLATKIEKFMLDGEGAILRLMSDLPTDLRIALQDLVRSLKKGGTDTTPGPAKNEPFEAFDRPRMRGVSEKKKDE